MKKFLLVMMFLFTIVLDKDPDDDPVIPQSETETVFI